MSTACPPTVNSQTGSFALIEHAIAEAEASGVSAIILDMDLEGDDMELARDIAHLIAQSATSVYALVNPRAWNAAALIALACDSIYMTAGATLGGNGRVSLPDSVDLDSVNVSVPELFARYARRRGLNPSIGRAMVDAAVVIPGVSNARTRLELQAQQAVQLGVAVAVLSVEELLEQVDLKDSRVMVVDEEWLATTVRIENHNWNNINIFVSLSGGMRLRLGTVTSNSSATYTVPGHVLLSSSYIRVVAEIIGSDEGASTEIVQVEPGLVIEWALENVLRNSTYFIWIRR